MLRSERIDGFVREVREWYRRHKRDLPWRDIALSDPSERAYQVLVSEVMLQQTQVDRVKIVFKSFLRRLPKIHDLARASNRDVLMAWRGMGYNGRALRLRDAAKVIVCKLEKGNEGRKTSNVERLKGARCFPMTMEELTSLPGVGHYTAAAIRNFAFGIPTPCLDTNIRRILHRVFIGPEYEGGTWEKDDQYLLGLAEEVLDVAMDAGWTAADWHAALMDYGSLVCTKRNPRWDICPLAKKGLMKAAWKKPKRKEQCEGAKTRREPGRFVGSTFVPNRIFRGRIVEELRDSPRGLAFREIGKRVCIDWNEQEHQEWLGDILRKLEKDHLLEQQGKRYFLKS